MYQTVSWYTCSNRNITGAQFLQGILYYWPEEWLSEVETCYQIKDTTLTVLTLVTRNTEFWTKNCVLCFFAPCIVVQLCSIKQRAAHFSNSCFNSIFGVFYMFRTSWVHHQEDSLYTQLLYGVFFMLTKAPCKTVFLIMNPWGLQHVEDEKKLN